LLLLYFVYDFIINIYSKRPYKMSMGGPSDLSVGMGLTRDGSTDT